MPPELTGIDPMLLDHARDVAASRGDDLRDVITRLLAEYVSVPDVIGND